MLTEGPGQQLIFNKSCVLYCAKAKGPLTLIVLKLRPRHGILSTPLAPRTNITRIMAEPYLSSGHDKLKAL